MARAGESLKTAKERAAEASEQAAEAKTAAREVRAERAAHRQTKAELEQTRLEITSTRQALVTAQSEVQHYASALPAMAYCPACRGYTPRSEWDERPAEGGVVHVYHTKHGYQPKATLTKLPSVMFMRGGTK